MESADFNKLLDGVQAGEVQIDEPISLDSDFSKISKVKTWDLHDFLDEKNFPKRQPIVEGILYAQEFIILSGPAKIGKSLLSLNLALSVASGEKFLGRFATRQGRVLILQTEIAPDAFGDRIRKMLKIVSVESGILRVSTERIMLDDKKDFDRLRNTLLQIRPDLTIIDPFYCAHRKDEDKAAQIAPILSDLSQLFRKVGTACALVHHQGKKGESDGRQTGHQHRGSSAFADVPDGSWSITRQKGGLTQLSFELRNGPAPEPITIECDENLWWRAKETPHDVTRIDRVVGFLSDKSRVPRQELLRHIQTNCQISERASELVIDSGIQTGRIIKQTIKGRTFFDASVPKVPQSPRELRNLGGAESGTGGA
jgi:hypothetical protein